MTIAIALVVGDGVVLGTDSATSIILPGERYENIYLNAEKMINLVKGLPIGLMTYGLGSISHLSIASLARVLRDRLSGEDESEPGWALDLTEYTMEEVANAVKRFFYDEMYEPIFKPGTPAPGDEPGDAGEKNPTEPAEEFHRLGFVVAGFGAESYFPEVWSVAIDNKGQCQGPENTVQQGVAGIIQFWGQEEALNRLVYGWSVEAQARLVKSGLSPELADRILVSYARLAHPGMPIQDAIDLVQYLADVTAGYMRFKPGIPSVAPPIDIAAITRHQGFRWTARKHYYPKRLNPVEYTPEGQRHPPRKESYAERREGREGADSSQAIGDGAEDA